MVAAMKHAWDSYVTYAWGHDELDPIARTGKDGFGGLGATVCLITVQRIATPGDIVLTVPGCLPCQAPVCVPGRSWTPWTRCG